ncbi:hypothetical protein F4821DRAFT_279657 [Hypoxylon rubiginosum]|uniref:Uncharacterized protein n=1 Tax=Hypoxylon rubiginosum TaxID=110542 RepID=A0ACC0CXL6_9PEZI|nr:hypothetical protein F4821DRAFT_279657 [Hypoxylon rubiginosum]
MFPNLDVFPRPEPEPANKDDHDIWLQEYEKWGSLKCPCGRGYFCRCHGSWVSGLEVGSGKAPTWDQQKRDLCPDYHYGDSTDVKSYIGYRDAFIQEVS